MTVRELVAALQGMPQDAEVRYLYNTYGKSEQTIVWQAASHMVIIDAPMISCFLGEKDDVMLALRRVGKE